MQIEHQPERQRFVTKTEFGDAELTYAERAAGVLDLQHTFVPGGAREQGLGSALAEFAMNHARQNDLKVIPTCSFVQGWLAEHPTYQDVVKADS
ncbi:MAG: GNAT family N-acetyltransferase [Gemmatimonadota bacterium]